MTFAQRLRQYASRQEPALNRAILRAVDQILASVPESAIASALETGNVFAVLALFDDALLDTAYAGVRVALTKIISDATTESFIKQGIPRARELTGVFNVLNPRVIDAVRQLDTKVTDALKTEARAVIQQAAERGLREGVNPRTTARSIRQAVGLGPTQEEQVQNFRRALESGDVSKALSYQKRDRRFDASIRRGTLTPEQINKQVDIYRKRRIALNAESVARTAALDSVKAAQRMSWESAIERGIVERRLMRKMWIATQDSRTRDEHAALNGEVVGFDEAFSNGEVTPGAASWNCRCVARYFQAREG